MKKLILIGMIVLGMNSMAAYNRDREVEFEKETILKGFTIIKTMAFTRVDVTDYMQVIEKDGVQYLYQITCNKDNVVLYRTCNKYEG